MGWKGAKQDFRRMLKKMIEKEFHKNDLNDYDANECQNE